MKTFAITLNGVVLDYTFAQDRLEALDNALELVNNQEDIENVEVVEIKQTKINAN